MISTRTPSRIAALSKSCRVEHYAVHRYAAEYGQPGSRSFEERQLTIVEGVVGIVGAGEMAHDASDIAGVEKPIFVQRVEICLGYGSENPHFDPQLVVEVAR